MLCTGGICKVYYVGVLDGGDQGTMCEFDANRVTQSMKCCCGAINWRTLTCEQGAASLRIYPLLSYNTEGGGAFCANTIVFTIACVRAQVVRFPVVTGIRRCAELVSHR